MNPIGVAVGTLGESTTFSLRDGKQVTIRPIRSSDLELERAFVAGLSATTGYQRLFSGRTPTPAELQRWVDVDQVREVALIALVKESADWRQVGVARYVITDTPNTAEFAIVLSDGWHGEGLGRALLTRLIAVARSRQLEALFGSTLADNQSMIKLAVSLGFKTRRAAGAASVTDLHLELPRPGQGTVG